MSGRMRTRAGDIRLLSDILSPIPAGHEVVEVAAPEATALTVPAGATMAKVSNPVAIRIAFGVEATATIGSYYPANACPELTSPEQLAAASIYWTAACDGFVQYFK